MNFLQALIGQQAGTEAANDVANGINVFANRGQPAEEGPYQPSDAEINQYDALLMDNTEAIRKRKRAVEAGEAEADRRGMFGIGGTLRDVLGLIGDSYLVGQGRNPMYMARRDKEKLSDAQAGFSVNPRAAAERMGYYDPAAGREALSDYEQQELRKAQQQSLQDARNSQIADRTIRQNDKATLATQGILSTPGAIAPDGSITPAAMQAIGQIAKVYQTTPEALLGGLTGDAARLYARGRIDPYQQERLVDYDEGLRQGARRVATGERNASTAERRAARPPAGSRPPQITEAQMLDNFMKIPPNQRTPEQQNFIDKKTKPATRGGRSLRSDPLGTGSAPARRLGPPRN